jgi:hypothetical protein
VHGRRPFDRPRLEDHVAVAPVAILQGDDVLQDELPLPDLNRVRQTHRRAEPRSSRAARREPNASSRPDRALRSTPRQRSPRPPPVQQQPGCNGHGEVKDPVRTDLTADDHPATKCLARQGRNVEAQPTSEHDLSCRIYTEHSCNACRGVPITTRQRQDVGRHPARVVASDSVESIAYESAGQPKSPGDRRLITTGARHRNFNDGRNTPRRRPIPMTVCVQVLYAKCSDQRWGVVPVCGALCSPLPSGPVLLLFTAHPARTPGLRPRGVADG